MTTYQIFQGVMVLIFVVIFAVIMILYMISFTTRSNNISAMHRAITAGRVKRDKNGKNHYYDERWIEINVDD